MAFGLNGSTNIPALNAWRNLKLHNSNVAASTERLASGLRINRASDDPAGLVRADRLASHRRGLQVATRNVQEGLSLLQTAEVGISSIIEMVNLIREEAVTAASATNQSDRNASQERVEELLAEINRTAAQTTFNGHELLSGSLTALVSTSDSALRAHVNGTPVVGGEYRVEVNTSPGAGQVLSTTPFTLRASGNTQYPDGNRGRALDVTDTLVTPSGANPDLAEDDFTLWINQEFTTTDWGDTGNTANRDFRLETATIPGGASGVFAVSSHDVADSSVGAHSGFVVATGGGTIPADTRSYMRVELDAVAGTNTTATDIQLDGAATQTADFIVTRVDPDGTEVQGTITLDGTQLVAATDLPFEVGNAGYTDVYAAANSDTRVTFGGVGESWTVGDTLLFTIDPDAEFSAGDETIRVLREAPGRDDFPAADTTGDSLSNGAATYQPTRVGLRSYFGPNVTGADGREVDVSIAYLDSGAAEVGTGTFRFGTIGDTVAASPQTVEFNLHETSRAERVTRLDNLSEFMSGGFSLFDTGPQVLNLHAGGLMASLSAEGAHSLEDLAESLREAIRRPVISGGLGMGVDGDFDRTTGVDANLAVFVDNPTSTGVESIVGRLVMRSSVAGPEGEFSFSGSGDLIDGLAFVESQGSDYSTFTAELFDAQSGQLLKEASSNYGTFWDLPEGIDLRVDPDVQVAVTWDNTDRELEFDAAAGRDEFDLHVAPHLMELQVGAFAGDTIAAPIAEINTETLGLAGLLVVDDVHATQAIELSDRALDVLGQERAKVGGLVTRMLNAESVNDLTEEWVTYGEDAIRNVDLARETIEWTMAALQADQAAAILAQANVRPRAVWSLLMAPMVNG
jgi:flagellin